MPECAVSIEQEPCKFFYIPVFFSHELFTFALPKTVRPLEVANFIAADIVQALLLPACWEYY